MNNLIIIGSSTGGPSHIKKILQALPIGFSSSIVVAQHMAESFIDTFVKHMDIVSKLEVCLAEDKVYLKEATIYIASGGCEIIQQPKGYQFNISTLDKNEFNPNINILFNSCANFSNSLNLLAIILTGMGNDGANGMKKLCETKANCLVENENSAVVYGMPQRSKEVCPRVKEESLEEIILTIQRFGA